MAPVGIERFRPNIVLAGLEAHDEDRLDVLRIAAGARRCSCGRSSPARAARSPTSTRPRREIEPAGVATRCRPTAATNVVNGAVTFGMNAIVLQGADQTLRVGQAVTADWRFD